MDKNEHKKSYRPCIQHWKFITIKINKLKKIKYNNSVLKPYIISFDIINSYENTGPNNRNKNNITIL